MKRILKFEELNFLYSGEKNEELIFNYLNSF